MQIDGNERLQDAVRSLPQVTFLDDSIYIVAVRVIRRMQVLINRDERSGLHVFKVTLSRGESIHRIRPTRLIGGNLRLMLQNVAEFVDAL